MIYLDFAAATPISEKAFEAMKPYFTDSFFNPSAPYLAAKKVREAYEDAKDELAHTIGAKGADLVITAGATESVNLAFSTNTGKVLYLATEHAAVRECAKQFSHEEIAVDKTGLIDLKDLKRKISSNVTMVSVALANNELGTIQPMSEIAEIIREERQKRLAHGDKTPIYLHSDASQAMSLIDINVKRLGVDLLTLNSAKVYGPKGIGALYIAHGIKLSPIVYGGGQERGLRSGTENVPLLIGFSKAAVVAKEHINGNRKKYEKLNVMLRDEFRKAKITPIFLGNKKHSLANFCTVSFPGIDAERLIYMLEDQEIYVSTGAACAASKGEKSHVLAAIGLSDTEIAGSIRITMGMLNDEEQICTAGKAIVAAVNAEAERVGIIKQDSEGENE